MSVASANQQLATELGLNYDCESSIVTGTYNGYYIASITQNSLRQIIVLVSNGTGQIPEKGALRQAHKENKETPFNPSVQDYRVTYSIPNAIFDGGRLERSAATTAVLTKSLKTNCLHDCSELGGRPDESNCYHVNGGFRFLTRDKYDTERNRAQSSFNEQNGKRGSPIAGIVGTLVRSLAGLFMMVLIDQSGLVLPWMGLIMSVCTAEGHELLPGKFNTVGFVRSILVMTGMTHLGNQLDRAITTTCTYEANVLDAFPVVNEVIEVDELLPVYYRNLALYYFAMLYDAPPTIYGLMRDRQLFNAFYLIGPEVHEPVVYVSSENGIDSE